MKNSKFGRSILTQKHNDENGFTIVEVIISLVIFLIISASIFGLLQVTRVDRNRSSQRNDILKNARVAVHLIGRDALNAGLGYHRRGAIVPDNFLSSKLGIPSDTNNDRDILTSIVAGNNVNSNNLQPDPNVKTDLISFAFRDLDFNDSDVVELENVTTPNGSPQIAQLITKAANGANRVRANDLYLLESDTSQVAVMATGTNNAKMIQVAPTDPLNLNQPLNGLNENGSLLRKCADSTDTNCTTYVASLKRFFLVKYHVKEDGTLVRTVYGNNRNAANAAEQIQEFPLAYNVENMQIKYVLKNGKVTDNPSINDDGTVGRIEDFNLIRQITVTLTVQALENDGQTQRLDKVTVSATFSARNMEYDAG